MMEVSRNQGLGDASWVRGGGFDSGGRPYV